MIFPQVDERWDADHVAEQALRERYRLFREDFTGTWILKFFGHADPADLRPVWAAFANGKRIESAAALGDPALGPGKYVVRIGLYDSAQPNAARILAVDGNDAFNVSEFEVK